MSSDTSSDSDNEDYSKFSEAVIEIPAGQIPGKSSDASCSKSLDKHVRAARISTKPSVRNGTHFEAGEIELQVTPEFRSFVAKRLSSKIDSELEISYSDTPVKSKAITEDESGFRLFSTCRPGDQTEKSATRWQKCSTKRTLSSSSESDEESNDLASVAVSGDYILQHSEIRPEIKTENLAVKTKTSESTISQTLSSQHQKNDGVPCISTTKKKKKKKKKHKFENIIEEESSQVKRDSTDIGKQIKKLKEKKRDNCDMQRAGEKLTTTDIKIMKHKNK